MGPSPWVQGSAGISRDLENSPLMLGRLLGWSNSKATEKSGAWKFSLTGEAPTLRLMILRGSRPATFAQVLQAWTDDPDFRLAYSAALVNCQFSAFRWELPRSGPGVSNGPQAGRWKPTSNTLAAQPLIRGPGTDGEAPASSTIVWAEPSGGRDGIGSSTAERIGPKKIREVAV